MIMAATFVDYAIAIGLLLVAFAATISYVTSFSTSAQSDIKLATLQLQAQSLLGLAEREYAFDTSVSGLGLVARMTNTSVQPPTESLVISSAVLQNLASKQYMAIREDFDFRIRIIDSAGATTFSYGLTPPLTNVVALQKPVLYQSGSETRRGTFAIEVW